MNAPNNGDVVVEMRDISRAFGGVQAVDNVSIEIRAGEVLGLLGHNGAGKSTLISILSGATLRDTGDILVDGDPVSINSPKESRDLGIETIYQNLALADNLDAAANLFLGRELKHFGLFRDVKTMKTATEEVLSQINPRFHNLSVPVGSLSGGQRQSIAIARAVHFKARVLIMDEPTAALGPSETALFKELVAHLTARGVAIVLISHDIHDVFELADRLVVMADGRVVGRLRTHEATKEQVLEMIILGGSKEATLGAAEPALAQLVADEAAGLTHSTEGATDAHRQR
ncbi:ATP-binding cassette domain-containing protein [Streptomyces sp. NPDC002276]